jgi:flagellar assembly protein FliH
MEEVRSLAVDVAFAAVCRMVGSLSVSPAAIAGCVTEQLAQLPHAGPVTVALHPDDLEILRNSGHTLPLPLRTVTLQPDDTLSLGGCRVATDHGHYDASLETQLRRLKAVIEQHRQTVLRSHG